MKSEITADSGRERRIAEAAKTMRACKARMEDAETKADEWRRVFADAKLKYEAACSATEPASTAKEARDNPAAPGSANCKRRVRNEAEREEEREE